MRTIWIVVSALAMTGCSQAPDPGQVFSDPAVVSALRAACKGNISKEAQTGLSQSNVNAIGKNGFSPLYWMLKECPSPAATELLVRRGADPHKFLPEPGISPAILVVRDFPVSYLQIMIEGGMDANYRYGELIDAPTLLFQAIMFIEQDKVEALLEAGANIEERNASGETPLLFISANQHRIGLSLLKAGADPKARSSDGQDICDVIRATQYTPPESGVDHRARFLEALRVRGVFCNPPIGDPGVEEG
jgi:ankyrin repeat protein